MPRQVDEDLLDDFMDAGNLLCLFGEQLREWGEGTANAVARAVKAGVASDTIREVLIKRGHEVANVKTMRLHWRGECRCPRRRGR